MNTLEFLEHMAMSPQHRDGLADLISMQPLEISTAYNTNNNNLIKRFFGEAEFIANPTDVVQCCSIAICEQKSF